MSFLMITARAGIFLTVLSYVWLDNEITAEQVFVIGGYYLIIRISCTVYFPLGLNAVLTLPNLQGDLQILFWRQNIYRGFIACSVVCCFLCPTHHF